MNVFSFRPKHLNATVSSVINFLQPNFSDLLTISKSIKLSPVNYATNLLLKAWFELCTLTRTTKMSNHFSAQNVVKGSGSSLIWPFIPQRCADEEAKKKLLAKRRELYQKYRQKVKAHKCAKCSKSFADQRRLEDHKKKVHLNQDDSSEEDN